MGPFSQMVAIVAVAGLCTAGRLSDFEGTWVFHSGGQPVFKLTLTVEARHVTGSMTKPSELSIGQDGDVTRIGPDQFTQGIQKAEFANGRLELTIDDDRFVMTVQGGDRAMLQTAGMRPFQLERATGNVVLATRLAEPEYPPDISALREQLHAMVKEDQDARLAFDHARMQAADRKSRSEVLRIFDRHGWITYSLAGKEASNNFWLLVQHQTPEIQRRMLSALKKAAKAGDASMSNYVYLYDRVQIGLGKPQRWGTQVTCENGRPVLSPVDDLTAVERRRKELYMMPIGDYLHTGYLVEFCAQSASGHQ